MWHWIFQIGIFQIFKCAHLVDFYWLGHICNFSPVFYQHVNSHLRLVYIYTQTSFFIKNDFGYVHVKMICISFCMFFSLVTCVCMDITSQKKIMWSWSSCYMNWSPCQDWRHSWLDHGVIFSSNYWSKHSSIILCSYVFIHTQIIKRILFWKFKIRDICLEYNGKLYW